MNPERLMLRFVFMSTYFTEFPELQIPGLGMVSQLAGGSVQTEFYLWFWAEAHSSILESRERAGGMAISPELMLPSLRNARSQPDQQFLKSQEHPAQWRPLTEQE